MHAEQDFHFQATLRCLEGPALSRLSTLADSWWGAAILDVSEAGEWLPNSLIILVGSGEYRGFSMTNGEPAQLFGGHLQGNSDPQSSHTFLVSRRSGRYSVVLDRVALLNGARLQIRRAVPGVYLNQSNYLLTESMAITRPQ